MLRRAKAAAVARPNARYCRRRGMPGARKAARALLRSTPSSASSVRALVPRQRRMVSAQRYAAMVSKEWRSCSSVSAAR